MLGMVAQCGRFRESSFCFAVRASYPAATSACEQAKAQALKADTDEAFTLAERRKRSRIGSVAGSGRPALVEVVITREKLFD
jgi:hypothetical protein